MGSDLTSIKVILNKAEYEFILSVSNFLTVKNILSKTRTQSLGIQSDSLFKDSINYWRTCCYVEAAMSLATTLVQKLEVFIHCSKLNHSCTVKD